MEDCLVEVLTEDEIKVVIQQIFKRSQTDWEFRQLCLNDPVAAIRLTSGKALPEGFDLQFLDGSDKHHKNEVGL
jgi:hypothetical protein